MSKKEEAKKLADLQHYAKIRTDSLNKELEINRKCTKIISVLWEEKISNYARTTMHYQFLGQQRFFIKQMDFKDKLIKKLQDEIYKYMRYRDKNNLILVNDTLSAFKKDIVDIHNQHAFEINKALPNNMNELENIIMENNKYWRILKYDDSVLQIQTKNRNFIIEDEQILTMINEEYRVKFDVRQRAMKDKYLVMLNKNNKLTENLMNNYLWLREKDDRLTIVENKLRARIKELQIMKKNTEKKTQEPTSKREVNMLIKDRDELQKLSVRHNNGIKKQYEYGQKQLFVLCKTTKEAYSEMSNVLKMGNDLMKNIRLCQRLETSQDRANVVPTCDEPACWLAEDQNVSVELGNLLNFFQRVSYVKSQSKSMDEEINQWQCKNNNIKKLIRNLEENNRVICLTNTYLNKNK